MTSMAVFLNLLVFFIFWLFVINFLIYSSSFCFFFLLFSFLLLVVRPCMPYKTQINKKKNKKKTLLLTLLTLPTRITDCGSHSPVPLDFSVASDPRVCSTMVFCPLGNADHVFVLLYSEFPSSSKGVLLVITDSLLLYY